MVNQEIEPNSANGKDLYNDDNTINVDVWGALRARDREAGNELQACLHEMLYGTHEKLQSQIAFAKHMFGKDTFTDVDEHGRPVERPWTPDTIGRAYDQLLEEDGRGLRRDMMREVMDGLETFDEKLGSLPPELQQRGAFIRDFIAVLLEEVVTSDINFADKFLVYLEEPVFAAMMVEIFRREVLQTRHVLIEEVSPAVRHYFSSRYGEFASEDDDSDEKSPAQLVQTLEGYMMEYLQGRALRTKEHQSVDLFWKSRLVRDGQHVHSDEEIEQAQNRETSAERLRQQVDAFESLDQYIGWLKQNVGSQGAARALAKIFSY